MAADTVANIIAFLALGVSVASAYFYGVDRRYKKYASGHEYAKQLLDWYSEVIRTLICLRHKAESKKPNLTEELIQLSALIERGRFFFPNIDKNDKFGADKPLAYRGYRNLALDFLVASYNLYNRPNPRAHLAQAEKLSRYFTSIVFGVVRPTDNLREIREMTDRYFIDEKIFEDFVHQDHSRALDFIWAKR